MRFRLLAFKEMVGFFSPCLVSFAMIPSATPIITGYRIIINLSGNRNYKILQQQQQQQIHQQTNKKKISIPYWYTPAGLSVCVYMFRLVSSIWLIRFRCFCCCYCFVIFFKFGSIPDFFFPHLYLVFFVGCLCWFQWIWTTTKKVTRKFFFAIVCVCVCTCNFFFCLILRRAQFIVKKCTRNIHSFILEHQHIMAPITLVCVSFKWMIKMIRRKWHHENDNGLVHTKHKYIL